MYGFANPIKHIDPTGKRPCQKIPLQEYGVCLHDPMPFKEYPGFSTGLKMFELYSTTYVWKNEKNWWSSYQCDEDDIFSPVFSLEHFIGLMIMYEINTLISEEENFIEAAGRQIWMECQSIGCIQSPYCIGNTCYKGAFNFLAQYVQSSHGRANKPENFNPIDYPFYRSKLKNDNTEVMKKAFYIGNKILHTPEWKKNDINKPFDWGSVDIDFNHFVVNNATGKGLGRDQYVLFSDPTIMLTLNQRSYWKAEYDKHKENTDGNLSGTG